MCVLFGVMFVSVLCLGVKYVQASNGLEISEIMYDPSGTDTNREWIEVHNTSSESIDLAGYFLLTDGLSSSHHALAPVGASAIPHDGYAVIVQDVNAFKTDYPNYSGLLFDSSWTGLTASSGKTIALIDTAGVVLDQVTYDPSIGATNDGNSLQKNSTGAWVSAPPTPNSALQNTDTNSHATTDTGTNEQTTNQSASSVSVLAPVSSEKNVESKATVPHIDFSIPKIATTGIPVPIVYTVYGAQGDIRYYGSVHIAFGDGSEYGGSSKDETSHIYQSAGTYIVKLDYRSNSYIQKPDMSVRATVVVSSPSVVVSQVTSDDSIVLANTSTSEADISGWILTATLGEKKNEFHIPDGTIIAPKAIVTVPASVVGFLGDVPTITLSLPLHIPVSTYTMSIENETDQPIVAATPNQRATISTIDQSEKSPETNVEMNSALALQPTETKTGKSFFWYAMFLLVVIACSVYSFLRFVGIKKQDGDIPIVREAFAQEVEGEHPSGIDDVRIVEE
ncbi:MAG: lamin tail domain-containing protein [bacterium]